MAKKSTEPAETSAKKNSEASKDKSAGRPKTAKNPQADTKKPQSKPKAKSKRQKKNAVRPSPVEVAIISDRRKLVWELYSVARLPIRQISEHLKTKNFKGASPTQVHADIKFLLAENEANLKFSVEEYVEIECAILDDIQATLYPKLKSSRVVKDAKAAADGIINCIEARAKLRGLNKPREIKLLTDEAFAALLGIEPEALPDDKQG